MTGEYQIVADGTLLYMRPIGVQTLEVCVKRLQDLLACPEYRPDLWELADLSDVQEIPMVFSDVRSLARKVCQASDLPAGGHKRIGIFAKDDTSFGMARMFSTLIELEAGSVIAEVFRAEDEALTFLNRPERRIADLLEDKKAFAAE